MKLSSTFRSPLFWQLLILLSGSALCMLALHAVANHRGWNTLIPLSVTLLLCVLASIIFAQQVASSGEDLAATIASGSINAAEQKTENLRGTVFAEAAAAWQNSLRSLQSEYLDKQTEASQNYSTLVDLMLMIAKAVDERTSYLRGHSERVAAYSAEIARQLGIDSAQVSRIRLAGLLHDIGTVGIEDSIVRKETPLTPEEFEIVKAHTVKGASILRPIESLGDLIPGIELHHESLDGHGYPFGLKGEEIPVMARIIAVADSFDAMTTARPYQSAMDPQYVLEVLNRLAGTRYDASVVNALTTLVQNGTIVVKSLRPPVSFTRRRVLTPAI